jgi:hypothetical protein
MLAGNDNEVPVRQTLSDLDTGVTCCPCRNASSMHATGQSVDDIHDTHTFRIRHNRRRWDRDDCNLRFPFYRRLSHHSSLETMAGISYRDLDGVGSRYRISGDSNRRHPTGEFCCAQAGEVYHCGEAETNSINIRFCHPDSNLDDIEIDKSENALSRQH